MTSATQKPDGKAADEMMVVEANEPHLVRVRLAFRHGGLFDGAIDDAAHDVAVLLVHSQAYTVKHIRKGLVRQVKLG